MEDHHEASFLVEDIRYCHLLFRPLSLLSTK